MLPYHQILQLNRDVHNVTCCNFTDGACYNLPAGTHVWIQNVYDAFHTTVQLGYSDSHRVAREAPEGWENLSEGGYQLPDGKVGYRFIVLNTDLREATGAAIPDVTQDLVGDLIAYENGELDEEDTLHLLHQLKDSGLANSLQGHYGRAIANL